MRTEAILLSFTALLTIGRGAAAVAAPARATAEAAPRSSGAKPANAARAAVEKLLRASTAPPSAADLNTLGAGVDKGLIEIARDEAVEVPIRGRAISALAQIGTPTARAYLLRLIVAPVVPSPAATKAAPADAGAKPVTATKPGGTPAANVLLVRRAAIAFGMIGDPRAPDALAPLLYHADPDLRADAAVALALTRLPKAAALLRARLPLETDGRVRGHMTRQLSVLDAAFGSHSPTAAPAK